MKRIHIYIFAAFICSSLVLAGCSDKAVTLSEITGEVQESTVAEETLGYGGANDGAGTNSASASNSGATVNSGSESGLSSNSLSGADPVSTAVTDSASGSDSCSGTGLASGESASDTVICVYICGSVVHPGVYELPEGSRICDGLETAGGFAEGADESRINLAGFLHDGDMVFFPEVGEEIPEEAVTGSVAAGVTGSGSASNGLVNINTASADLLQTLPGIGASKANAIIGYREENGPFTDKSQIKNVSGIGENLYNNIEQLICI